MFAIIGMATSFTANAWTYTVECPDGSVRQCETVSEDFFVDENGEPDEKAAQEYFAELEKLMCQN